METLRWALFRCWPLGPTCEVNWDAWAAIGTMVGVLTALAAPWIRDFALRRKADAVFALAYKKSMLDGVLAVSKFERRFREDPSEKIDSESGEALRDFKAITDELLLVAAQDLDVSRWPAVSQGLAHSVAEALYLLRQFEPYLDLMVRRLKSEGPSEKEWNTFHRYLAVTASAVRKADDQCLKSIKRGWRR